MSLSTRARRYLAEHPSAILLAILAAALAFRLATIVASPEYAPVFDSGDYVRHAVEIAAGDGYPESVFVDGPTAFRPPTYPYLLGGVYAIVGDSAGETAGRITGALLGTLVVYLIFLVGRELWGRGVGLVAAAIAAVFPPLVYLNTALLTEPLFLTIVLGIVVATLAARGRGGDWRYAALAGGLCGLAALTRANGILLVIPAILGVWVVRPLFSRAALVAPVALVVAAVLAVLPWTVRNSLEFDRLVPVSTQSGFAMAGAMNDEARSFPDYPASWVIPRRTERYEGIYARDDLNEAELDRELRQSAVDYAAEHPGYVLESTVRNTLRTFDLMAYPRFTRIADEQQLGIGAGTGSLIKWTTYLLDLLALAGLVALLLRPRERRGAWFIWLIPVLMVLAAVWLITSTRYRAPAYPFMILLAAIAITDLWTRFAPKRLRPPRQADQAEPG